MPRKTKRVLVVKSMAGRGFDYQPGRILTVGVQVDRATADRMIEKGSVIPVSAADLENMETVTLEPGENAAMWTRRPPGREVRAQ